jgi:nucleotide-binding universal stress UspA family protein
VDRTGSAEEAFDFARAIARSGDEVLLLHAVPLAEINPVLMPKGVSVADLRERVRVDAETELAALPPRVNANPGVHVHTLVIDGAPAEAIVEQAPSPESSMIIMMSHGRGALGRLTYGSVADRVARTSHAPVLLVRHATEKHASNAHPIDRLVVPLDGSTRSERSLPTAIALARRLDVPILLVAVSEVERMATIYGSALSAAAYAELATDAERELVDRLNEVAERVRAQGATVSTRVLSGAVSAAIESVTVPGDLIVMTSHGRGGVRRWLLGSVSERLARTASVPVMLVPSM